jgi:hypothetical protein
MASKCQPRSLLQISGKCVCSSSQPPFSNGSTEKLHRYITLRAAQKYAFTYAVHSLQSALMVTAGFILILTGAKKYCECLTAKMNGNPVTCHRDCTRVNNFGRSSSAPDGNSLHMYLIGIFGEGCLVHFYALLCTAIADAASLPSHRRKTLPGNGKPRVSGTVVG